MGAVSKNKIFRPFGPQFSLKVGGKPPRAPPLDLPPKIVQLTTYYTDTTATAKAKGTWVLPIVQMVLAFFLEDFYKANKDKTENNDKQMKYMMNSFEAQKEGKMT